MATTEFIAAIELGSSKITGVAGRKNSDGSMQVLAYAQEDSSTFIRKGVIFNLDKTAQSLTSIINRLEGEMCIRDRYFIPCFDGGYPRVTDFKYLGRQVHQPTQKEANHRNAA